jgi:hypothetical protein
MPEPNCRIMRWNSMGCGLGQRALKRQRLFKLCISGDAGDVSYNHFCMRRRTSTEGDLPVRTGSFVPWTLCVRFPAGQAIGGTTIISPGKSMAGLPYLTMAHAGFLPDSLGWAARWPCRRAAISDSRGLVNRRKIWAFMGDGEWMNRNRWASVAREAGYLFCGEFASPAS